MEFIADDWTPIFLLPNIDLDEGLEGGEVAIAPARDPRVLALCEKHQAFGSFTNRFKDAFGVSMKPSVLMLRSNAPRSYFTLEAVLAFRDIVSLSIVSNARALELPSSGGRHSVLFGDYFSCYPWMIDKNYEDLVGSSPAFLGIHQVSKFHGQSSPSLSRVWARGTGDAPLFGALMPRWRRRFMTDTPTWEDVALFRSLNMAYHASSLPNATDALGYDVGRLIALWVSAFEILVHPGGTGQATRDKVFDLLERAEWLSPKCRDRTYPTGSSKNPVNRTLASFIYQRLYDCRNNFLHGNPVTRDDLVVRPRNRGLYEYASPLYRVALSAFLGMTRPAKEAEPTEDMATYMARWLSKRMDFDTPQRAIERGLLSMLLPPDDEDD